MSYSFFFFFFLLLNLPNCALLLFSRLLHSCKSVAICLVSKSVIKTNTSNYKGTKKKKKKEFSTKKVGMAKIPGLLEHRHKIDYFLIHVERVLNFYKYKSFILFFVSILYSFNYNSCLIFIIIFLEKIIF